MYINSRDNSFKGVVLRTLYRRGRRYSTLDTRKQVILACFLATFTMYLERVGFSIAFAAMAKQAAIPEARMGQVLSAFFWGYACSQVPGGWLAQKWGGGVTLALAFAAWPAAVALTPSSGQQVWGIFAARVCVGLAQGFIIPSIHTVLAQWVAPKERAKAVSLTTSGMYLGSAAAMAVLPYLQAQMGMLFLMRLLAGSGFTWLLFWLPLGRRAPTRQAIIPLASGSPEGRSLASRPPSWGALFSHPAVWAIVANNFTFHYALYVVMNWLPLYFDQVLGASLTQVGKAKMLPYLAMFATSNAGAWFGDALIAQHGYSVASARKAVNSMGFWGAAAALLSMAAARGTRTGVAATTATLACAAWARGGFSVNHMDIAPGQAGLVMGVSNTAGTLAGVVGVTTTGYLLHYASGRAGWWAAFSLSSVLCLLGSFLFTSCAQGKHIFGEHVSSHIATAH